MFISWNVQIIRFILVVPTTWKKDWNGTGRGGFTIRRINYQLNFIPTSRLRKNTKLLNLRNIWNPDQALHLGIIGLFN